MLKKLIICILTLMMISLTLVAAQAEGDLPELTLDELIRWKKSQAPEYITMDAECEVIRGNLYEEYYGVTAAAVSDPLRAYVTIDRTMQVGVTSTLTVHASGGSEPYRYESTALRRLYNSTDPYYRTYGVYSSTETISITPEANYQYLLITTVYSANGDYLELKTSYREILSASSLNDPATLNGKVQSVIASEIRSGMTDREKALAIHNWLVNNAYYGYGDHQQEATGVLLMGKGVCESYTRAFQMFMSELGIPSVFVTGYGITGTGLESHSWNMIYVDGGWYHVDVTWDDPGTATVPRSGMESTTYFCVTDEFLLKDHIWNEAGLDTPVSGTEIFTPIVPEYPAASMGSQAITIQPGAFEIVKFTAPADNMYRFSATTSANIESNLYDKNLAYRYTLTSGTSGFDTYETMSAGETVYIGIRYIDPSASGTVNLEISCDSTGSLRFYSDGTYVFCGNWDQMPVGFTRYGINRNTVASVRIMSTPSAIEANAFSGCSNMTSVTIPRSVTSIGAAAFDDCTSLQTVYFRGTRSEWDAISISASNTALTNARIICLAPSSTMMVLPGGTTTVEAEAFAGDTAMTSLRIPSSVTAIGSGAFSSCTKLNAVVFDGNAPAIAADAFAGVTGVIYYPADNTTWTAALLQNYGGNLTWAPYSAN